MTSSLPVTNTLRRERDAHMGTDFLFSVFLAELDQMKCGYQRSVVLFFSNCSLCCRRRAPARFMRSERDAVLAEKNLDPF